MTPDTRAPAPTLTAITPDMRAMPGTFALSATGVGFDTGAVVSVGGVDMPTAFFDSTSLVANVTLPIGLPAGAVPIVVRNPDDKTSSAVLLTYTGAGTVPLVTLDQALAHIRYPDASVLLPVDVADLQAKLDTAHAWVLRYVAGRMGSTVDDWRATVAGWTPDTAPREVLIAIAMQFAELVTPARGDQDRPDRRPGWPCADAVNVLYLIRDPVFA